MTYIACSVFNTIRKSAGGGGIMLNPVLKMPAVLKKRVQHVFVLSLLFRR